MTDTSEVEDALELEEDSSAYTKKPPVISVPKDPVKYIFGTSQVFQCLDEFRSKPKGLAVPLKVREYYYQGQVYLEQESWEMAVLFFSRALHLDSKMVEFYALRAEAYIQLCDFSSAAQNLRVAYSFEPENTKYQDRLTLVLYIQGQCLYEQCSFEDALNVFSQASELQPQKACFRYRCMACLLALRRHQDCLLLLTKELKQGSANADMYILRARIYNFFRKASFCYRDLHSSLLLDPQNPQAKALLKVMVDQAQQARQDAGILAVQGNMQRALQRINCAIENNPLDPSLLFFRGIMYRRMRDFDGAVEDFLKALDLVPENQEVLVRQVQRQLLLAYNDFAVQCYRQGAYQEGVLLLNKALRDEQGEKSLYINRGDCFFQMGSLTFAEADYQQALALSPSDHGANLRMSLLQEKLGCWELSHRQFHKAESHFTTAIEHNPKQSRYYIQRAKSRQLLQKLFGARQDVATALILEPHQPQLLPLVTNLFPGMSVEEVLSSQVAQLARLQLQQLLETNQQFRIPKGIVGLLREREAERQKARAIHQAWMLEQPPPSKEPADTGQALLNSPEEGAEAQEEEEEGKVSGPRALRAQGCAERGPSSAPFHIEEGPRVLQGCGHWPRVPPACLLPQEEGTTLPPKRKTSLSSGYLDRTSSGSIFGFTATSLSETETSTIYRSISSTALTSSDSSLPKSPLSDSEVNKDASLQQNASKTKPAPGQNQSLGPSKDSKGPHQRPSKTRAPQASRATKTEDPQASGQRPSKTKGPKAPRRRLRKAKAVQSRSWGRSKLPAQGRSWGLSRSSSKTKDFCDLSQRPLVVSAAQDQSGKQSLIPSERKVFTQKSGKEKAAQGRSPSLSRTEVTSGPSQSPQRTESTQSRSQSAGKTKVTQSPSKTEPLQSPSQPLKNTSSQPRNQSPSTTKMDQGRSASRKPAP
ncbi:tetratricopeptide repeat protein 16 [Tenrec ecaudatus]|uniref:tetratricopeptide repeat protein 16 n=1 Tax=Tenrec ecaudatus TaxID=94439 RepID=UPI003F5A0503